MEDDDTDILRKAIQEAAEEFCPNSNEFFAVTPLETINTFMDEFVPVMDFDPTAFVAHVSAATPNANPHILQHRVTPKLSVIQQERSQSPPSTVDATAPLGSAHNPIELIREGDTYRATRALTEEQLQQVTLLLQQQRQEQLAAAPKTSGVVYNAANNTKIIYHIVQPEGLVGAGSRTVYPAALAPTQTGKKSVLKPWGRRRLEAEKEERIEAEQLSQEEKDRRKRQLARTRCGRVSKPPSYMVKDFKCIHPLDFDDEAQDGCDMGYADLVVADTADDVKSVETPPASYGRKRDYKCVTCNKAYIGKASLSRHYRLYPTHVPENLDTSGNSNDQNKEVFSRLQDGQALSSGEAIPANTDQKKKRVQQYLGWYWNRGLLRHKFPKYRNGKVIRKPTLKELLSCYSNEELLGDGMTELSKVAGTWEFLDTKCKQQPLPDNYIVKLYKELEVLTEKTSKVSQGFLEPCAVVAAEEDGPNRLNVTNEAVAKLLGISVGTYFIKRASGEQLAPSPSPGQVEPDTVTESLSTTSYPSYCSVSSVVTSVSSSCQAGEDSEVTETDGDSSQFPHADSNWSFTSQSNDSESSRAETLSPTLEYRTRLSNLNLAKDDESLSMSTILPAAAADDNAVEHEGMPTERVMHAEYLSRLAECKLMETPSDTAAGDRGLSFVSCCLELPAGLLGDESQLPGDVSELTGDDEQEMPGTLDCLLGAMTSSLSEDVSPNRPMLDATLNTEEMDISTMDMTHPLDKDFDILEMLDRAANSSVMQRRMSEDSCGSFSTAQSLVAVDNMGES